MGTNCGSHPAPNTDNLCSSHIGQLYEGQHFCTIAGSSGDPQRGDYCGAIGDKGEWGVYSQNGTCEYNSCDTRTDFGSGCCDGCCGIVGSGVTCRRQGFAGDPMACCFQDLWCELAGDLSIINSDSNNGTSLYPKCFEPGSSGKRTCAPEYRDLGSDACSEQLVNYCSGDLQTDLGWTSRWTEDNVTISTPGFQQLATVNQPCMRLLHRILYKNNAPLACQAFQSTNVPTAPSGTNVSTDGFIWAQKMMAKVIQNYVSNGGKLDAMEGEPGGNIKFNRLVKQICSQTPGLCYQGLKQFCSSATVDGMADHLETLKWCGCYMPPEQYSKYTNLYQINPECTPTCNNDLAIPLPDDKGTGVKSCQQSLCIIDDVSINLIRSRVGGDEFGTGISIANICNSCASAGSGTSRCDCKISNVNITAIDSQIGGQINISNSCQSTQCFSEVVGSDGTISKVPKDCSDEDAVDPYTEQLLARQKKLRTLTKANNIKIVLILLGAILICLVIWLILRPNGIPEATVVIEGIPNPMASVPAKGNHFERFPPSQYKMQSIRQQGVRSSSTAGPQLLKFRSIGKEK